MIVFYDLHLHDASGDADLRSDLGRGKNRMDAYRDWHFHVYNGIFPDQQQSVEESGRACRRIIRRPGGGEMWQKACYGARHQTF